MCTRPNAVLKLTYGYADVYACCMLVVCSCAWGMARERIHPSMALRCVSPVLPTCTSQVPTRLCASTAAQVPFLTLAARPVSCVRKASTRMTRERARIAPWETSLLEGDGHRPAALLKAVVSVPRVTTRMGMRAAWLVPKVMPTNPVVTRRLGSACSSLAYMPESSLMMVCCLLP